MSKFNDIANKLPKTYTFGRDKWFSVTDVLNLIGELQKAHEEEIQEINEAHKRTLDRINYERLEQSKTLVTIAERSRSVLDSLLNFVDPRREIQELLKKHSVTEAESVKRLAASGALDGVFTRDELQRIYAECDGIAQENRGIV